jgi:hypothetical protein
MPKSNTKRIGQKTGIHPSFAVYPAIIIFKDKPQNK